MPLAGKLSFPPSATETYQRLVKRAIQTKWEDRFRTILKGLGAPPWREHYRFHPVRRYEFDFAWPEYKIAFEIEGAIWMKGGGGHSHPLGIERDIEKYNLAAMNGWRIIRITDKMLRARTLFQDEAATLVQDIFRVEPKAFTMLG